jgi:hypothetical protein
VFLNGYRVTCWEKKVKKTVFMAAIAIVVVTGSGYTAASDTDSTAVPSVHHEKDSGSVESSAVTADSVAAKPVRIPLCTLIIKTEPESAAVSLDGTFFGLSPLMISNVDTGSHTLLLQKVGYYQKKVSLTLPVPGTSDLSFELSAPGHLVVTTEPQEVNIQINGAQQGSTPYTDSLVKPGTYRITLSRENYLPLEKTVTVPGGGSVRLNDTLSYTDEYRTARAVSEVKEHRKKRHFTVGVVAGALSLFLLVIAIIEVRE